MKNYFKYTIALLLCFYSLPSFSQNWQWAKSIKGTGGNIEVAQSIIDNDDNIYICGFFNNEILNAAEVPVTTAGNKDLFLSKYSPDGQLLWVRFGQSSSVDAAKGLVIDENNNVYLSGENKAGITFTDAVSPVTLPITAANKFDIFLAKYDTDGNLQWAKTIASGANQNKFGSVYYDQLTQNIITTGQFKGEVVFPGQSPINASTPTYYDFYISQFDPLDGSYIRSEIMTIDATGGYCNFTDIKRYGNNYYFLGIFAGTANLGSSQIASSASNDYDIVVYKTDLNFNETWNKKIQSTGPDFAYSLYPTNSGIHVSGYSQGSTLTIESTTPVSLTLDGSSYDGFSALYDHTGDLQDAQKYSSTGDVYIYEVHYDGQNLIYTGSFKDSLIVNNDTLVSTVLTESDVFWAVTDENNVPLYGNKTVGSASDKARSTLVDSNGDLYLAGSFRSDPFILYSDYGSQVNLTPSTLGFSSGFLAKYTLCDDYDVRMLQDSTTCPVSADGIATAIVCKDQTTGADTINYEWDFQWSNLNWTADSLGDSITNIEAGKYFLTLTNKYGCEYKDTIDLVSQRILETILTDTITLNCALDTLWSDTVFASFGQLPYHYQWSTGINDTLNYIDTILVGTHYVTVTDDCGTIVIDTIKVGHTPTLVATISTHNTIIACENGADGEAWMNTSNGYGTIYYNWGTESESTDYIASDLSIGKHYVTVNDACVSIVDSVNVVNLPSMNANISSSTPVSCEDNTDGKAETFVVGGVQPYTYLWSSGETTPHASNLPLGTAYVTVSDACSTLINSVEITLEPSLEIQLSATHETCSGGNGSVMVTTSNGSGTPTYAWDVTYPISATPISTNDTVLDLSANTYYVEVSDACGTKVGSIDLTTNAVLEATLSSHTAILNCDTSTNGSVSVIASNGVLPYTYTWSSSSSTTALASDLGAGTEYVTIKDQCGTEILDSIVVGYYPKLIAFAELMNNANCTNTNDGKASVIATGGVQPYTFNWSNSASTGTVAEDLPVGIQFVTVSDYCGSTKDSVEIHTLPALSFELSSSALQCPGDSLGIVTVTAQYGVLPYTYNWGGSSSDNTPMIDSLWAGMHYVTVSDLCAAELKDSIEIETTPTLNAYLTNHFVTVNCPSSSNGINEIIVNGGLAPYQYVWSTGATSPIIDNLNVGMHYASITDQCNIMVIDSVSVSHLPAIDLSTITNDPLCHNDINGNIEIEIMQGIYPISLDWADFDNANLQQSDLSAGTYVFSVTDQCATIIDSVTLNNPDYISIAANISEETSSAAMNGSIQTVVSGGTSPYYFLWNNLETSQDLINITAGIYTLEVTDYNDCKASQTFEVETKAIIIEPMEAFTPNSDGVNDVWDITNISEFPGADIKIFNQWGNLVFESKGYDEPWDGTNNGSELSAAVYYYIIDLKNDLETQTGSITLIR